MWGLHDWIDRNFVPEFSRKIVVLLAEVFNILLDGSLCNAVERLINVTEFLETFLRTRIPTENVRVEYEPLRL